MKTTQIFLLLGILLPLCTVVSSFSIKNNDNGFTKPGVCPPERYYIKASTSENIIKACKNDSECPGNMKCCVDNQHTWCKPPAQEKEGNCPKHDPILTTKQCNDNCTSDSECKGNLKCCFHVCGNTCVSTQENFGKPLTEIAARNGFCQQEALYRCLKADRISCDENSCIDGYKCCPHICRVECQKALPEKDGKCPVNAACPSGAQNKVCTSDYDCTLLHKCCSTACGQRCLKANDIKLNLFNPNNPSVNLG